MASQIVSGDRFVSGEALLERAGRAASGLESLGVGKGDTVALILRNDIAFLEASVAVGLLGAYPVAVNWHFSIAEAAYVLGDCSAKSVIIHADLYEGLAAAIPENAAALVVDTPPELPAAICLGQHPIADTGRAPLDARARAARQAATAP